MPEPVGIAVIGLDHWYSAFMVLDQIVGCADASLLGLADHDPARLEEIRGKYHPDTATTEFDRLLDDPRVELVFSFVDVAENADLCHQALGRGKHALCVKPAAMSVAEANQLAIAAEDAGVIFSSTEVLPRLTAKSAFLKAMLQDGTIGRLATFYQVAHGGLPQPWPGQQGESWWLDARRVPGGAWIDHAIYAVDQLRWTTEREVESVSGTLANRTHKDIAVEDYGLAWMRLENGVTAVMEDTWSADSGTWYSRWIGTDGNVTPEGDGFLVSKRGTTERIEAPREERSPVSRIVSSIRSAERLPFTSTCCVRNLSACLAVYESFRTGKHVTPG